MKYRVFLLACLLPGVLKAQPRLLLNGDDLVRIQALAAREPWAAAVRLSIVGTAEAWPQSHLSRFGLGSLDLPPEGGQWTLHYVCPTHGVRLQFTPPATHRCPVDSKTFSGWPYDQVILSNRHTDLADKARDLGIAYQFTRRREFAEAAAWVLLRYSERYLAYPLHDTQNKVSRSAGHVMAQTLDEAIWLISIAWAYDLVRDSGALSDEERQKVERDLLRAAASTIQGNDAGQSNWQSWHNAAIAAVGFTLSDAVLVSRAVDGPSGFRFQMKNSVIDEGFWYEGSWGYHFYALDALVRTAEMAARNRIDLWGTEPRLAALFKVPLQMTFSDGTLPAFNDSGVLNLFDQDSLYEVAYARAADRAFLAVLGRKARGRNALLWGAPSLPSGVAAPPASAVFDKAGYAVLRAPRKDHTVMLKFGPHGGGHGHYDKLGMISYAFGGIVGLDPGTQSYAAPTHETWDKMTVAHNATVVDEQCQSQATGRLLWWRTGPGFSAAAADAGPANRQATLTRSLLVTDNYALDLSEAQATDSAAHTFDWVYHGFGAAQTELPLSSWSGFGKANGYQHLTGNRAADTDGAWQLTFDGSPSSLPSYGSTYASNTNVRARYEISREQSAGGKFSGKAGYDLGGSGYLLFTTPVLAGVPPGKPELLRIMIYGDGSGHKLSLRLNDSTDERFVKEIGPVTWRGWKAIEVGKPETWSHYLGNDDGVFDSPVKTVTVQLDYVAGGPRTGALYVDNIVLAFAAGPDFRAADFETPIRKLRTWMAGATGTKVVTGNGLGPDLLQPVPYVLARRTGTSARFCVLLEPFTDEPAVVGFRETRPGVFEISGKGWTDRIDLSVTPMIYERTSEFVIPRLAGPREEWSGLAFVNAGDRTADLTCTAYDDQGRPLQGKEVANPRIFSLQPGEKIAALGTELFGFSLDSSREQDGWVQVTSSQPDVRSFFVFGDERRNFVDGAVAQSQASRDFLLPKLPRRRGGDYSAGLYIANPGDTAAELTLQAYDDTGGGCGIRSFVIAPHGRLRGDAAALCGTKGFTAGFIRGRSNVGLTALESFGGLLPDGAPSDAGALNALDSAAAATRLYAMHIVSGGGWQTGITISNPGTSAVTVEIRAVDDDGAPLDPAPAALDIAPGGTVAAGIAEMFDWVGPKPKAGYAEISVRSGGGVLGTVTFGTEDGAALASMPLEAEGGRNFVFAHVAQNTDWFTGVAILNPSNMQVPVTLSVLDSKGRLIGSKVIPLMPGGKRARVISEWVPEADQLAGGYIQISAPEDILCFGLFGNTGERVLAALPSQAVPAGERR